MSPSPASTRSRSDRAVALERAGKVLLFGGGLALVVWLVRSAGVDSVTAALERAGGWLPLVVLLEMGIIGTDFFAVRTLLGDAATSLSPAVWVRAMALAYASSILLPAGRAAGEAVRTATLAPSIGLGRATAACSRLQACVLLGNAALSVVASAVIWLRGASTTLALALLANGVLCALLSTALLWVVKSDRFARWLQARFPRFAQSHVSAAPAAAPRSTVVTATLLCAVGRAVQAVQYGVVLHAVGGLATPATALTAQGIHLVGAALGDLVPNQMGATEGAYRLFAPALGLGAAPAQALSIALIVRVAQLTLSGGCFLLAMAVVRQPRSAEAP